jgi:phosphoglycerate kinase
MLNHCKTIILNGPVGAFEYSPFSRGTFAIANIVASLTRAKKIVSVAGGGDIVAAISQAGLFEEFSYISTAGGAFLEWLEGKELPGLKVLED